MAAKRQWIFLAEFFRLGSASHLDNSDKCASPGGKPTNRHYQSDRFNSILSPGQIILSWRIDKNLCRPVRVSARVGTPVLYLPPAKLPPRLNKSYKTCHCQGAFAPEFCVSWSCSCPAGDSVNVLGVGLDVAQPKPIKAKTIRSKLIRLTGFISVA